VEIIALTDKTEEELKLPDHVLVREGDRMTVSERESGKRTLIGLPASVSKVERRSPVRFVAGLATALLAIYFSYMFLPGLFSETMEMALLPLMIAVPFIVGKAWNGKAAVISYLVVFFAFALYQGGLGDGGVRLGVIFFGGGPGEYTGYTVVPASGVLAALSVGILPFLTMKMLGQVLVTYQITISYSGQEYSMELRRQGLVKEVMAFAGARGGS
jgi:uncharacterized membrane protein YjgN (DUF898 family)